MGASNTTKVRPRFGSQASHVQAQPRRKFCMMPEHSLKGNIYRLSNEIVSDTPMKLSGIIRTRPLYLYARAELFNEYLSR